MLRNLPKVTQLTPRSVSFFITRVPFLTWAHQVDMRVKGDNEYGENSPVSRMAGGAVTSAPRLHTPHLVFMTHELRIVFTVLNSWKNQMVNNISWCVKTIRNWNASVQTESFMGTPPFIYVLSVDAFLGWVVQQCMNWKTQNIYSLTLDRKSWPKPQVRSSTDYNGYMKTELY